MSPNRYFLNCNLCKSYLLQLTHRNVAYKYKYWVRSQTGINMRLLLQNGREKKKRVKLSVLDREREKKREEERKMKKITKKQTTR